MGNSRSVTADLLDTSESGIGISLLVPLAIGSKVLVRGKLNERSDIETTATVMWCTEKINGNFHAGLELADHRTSTGNASQAADGRSHEVLDH
jgi:hypothetical protein